MTMLLLPRGQIGHFRGVAPVCSVCPGGRRGEESGLSTGPARAGQVPMRSRPGSSGAEGPVAATALGASCAGRWDSERPAPVGPWPPCPQTWVPPALPHPRQPACGPPCCAGARPPAASEKGCPGGSVPETLHTQVSLPYSHCSRGSVGGPGPGALPAAPRRLCCLFASLLLLGVPKPILTPALFFFFFFKDLETCPLDFVYCNNVP